MTDEKDLNREDYKLILGLIVASAVEMDRTTEIYERLNRLGKKVAGKLTDGAAKER